MLDKIIVDRVDYSVYHCHFNYLKCVLINIGVSNVENHLYRKFRMVFQRNHQTLKLWLYTHYSHGIHGYQKNPTSRLPLFTEHLAVTYLRQSCFTLTNAYIHWVCEGAIAAGGTFCSEHSSIDNQLTTFGNLLLNTSCTVLCCSNNTETSKPK